jgi:hypothetical protein
MIMKEGLFVEVFLLFVYDLCFDLVDDLLVLLENKRVRLRVVFDW